MAVVITQKTSGSNGNLGANGTVAANGLTTGGNSWVFVYASIGNNSASSVTSVTINGVAATKIMSQILPDGTSDVEWWGLWSASALAAVNVSVVFSNTAGAGANVITHEATGTDINSIGNLSPSSSGTSGSSSATVLCSFNLSVMLGGILTFGGSETGGANTTILKDQNDGAGDFATTGFNNQTTSTGTSYTFNITHNSGMWGAVALEVKPAGSGGSPPSTMTEDQRPTAHPYRSPKVTYPSSQAPDPAGAPITSTRTYFQAEPTIVAPRYHSPPPRPLMADAWQPPPIVIVPPSLGPFSPDPNPWVQRRIPPDPILEDAPGTRIGSTRPMGWDTSASRPQRLTLKQPRPDTAPFVAPPLGSLRSQYFDDPPLYRPAPRRWTRLLTEFLPNGDVVNNSPFPLSAHASGRYWVDKNGTRFDINMWTVWAAMMGSTAEQDALIAVLVSQNVNAVEFGWIWRDGAARSTRAPFANDSAILPFLSDLGGGTWSPTTVTPDFTTPNPAYDAFGVSFVDRLAAANILAFIFPMYVGTSGGGGSTPDDGWAPEVVQNGTARCQSWGAHIATLLKDRANVWYGLGGDAGTVNRPFTGSERDGVCAMVQGIQSVSGQASGPQFGAEWGTNSIAQDQADPVNGVSGPTLGDTCTVQTLYNFFGEFIANAARGYASSPTKPVVVQEGPFERENAITGTGFNPGATEPVRKWYAWAWLSGAIAGTNIGSGFIWPFNKAGSFPLVNWQLWTATQGLIDMQNMRALRRSVNWHLLVPTPSIITSNAGSGDGSNTSGPSGGATTTVVAATASDGTSIIIYYPPAQTGSITVDTSGMAGNYRARYYDMSNGTFTAIGGTGFTHVPGAGTVFAAPPTASDGNADGFIVLDAPAASLGAWFYEQTVTRPWQAVKRWAASAVDFFRSPAAALGSSWGGSEGPADSGALARRAGPGAIGEPISAPPLAPLFVTGWEGAGPAPAAPARRWARVPGGEIWLLAPAGPPPPILDGYLPSARPRAPRAGAEQPWGGLPLVGLAPWWEQSSVRSQQPRGQAQFEGQWLPTPLPPPSTPQGWNIYPARSGAATRPIQDLAGWMLPAIAPPAAAGWDPSLSPPRATGARARAALGEQLALGATILALPDVAAPAATRALARRPPGGDGELVVLATPRAALEDGHPTPARGASRALVDAWTPPPLVVLGPPALPDLAAPGRPAAPARALVAEPWIAPPSAAIAPWFEESPTRSQQPHGRPDLETFFQIPGTGARAPFIDEWWFPKKTYLSPPNIPGDYWSEIVIVPPTPAGIPRFRIGLGRARLVLKVKGGQHL